MKAPRAPPELSDPVRQTNGKELSMLSLRSIAVALWICVAASLTVPPFDAAAGEKTKLPTLTFERTFDQVKALTKCPGDKVEIELTEGGAKLSDPKTAKQIGRTLAHDRARRNVCKSIITCLAFSPDGSFVATGSRCELAPDGSEGQICVWDVTTGKRLAEYSVDERNRKPIGDVQDLAFSEDGKTILFRAKRFEIDGP
jgi:WD40 repeat protein